EDGGKTEIGGGAMSWRQYGHRRIRAAGLLLLAGFIGGNAVDAAIMESAPITMHVSVYPNPWRVDRDSQEQVTFAGLAANSTVKIFTVSGQWVKTLPLSSDKVSWDLTNDAGQRVASGIYLYVVKAGDSLARGKFAV